MAKSIKKLLEETEKLNKENAALKQKLNEAKKSIDAIKSGGVDALIIADEKNLKVYTDKNTDKIYRVLIENMHEGAVTLDDNGTILYANSYFANMVSLPLQKVIGTKLNSFIDDRSNDRFQSIVQHGRENPLKDEIYLYTHTKEVLPVLMSLTALSLDNAFVLSVIVTDLTILHKNQEELRLRAEQLVQKNIELELANRDLRAFTHVSSHDLQEPLRKIQVFIDCVLREESGNVSNNGENYLRKIDATAKRMRTLIEDLLSFSRTTNGKHKFEQIHLTIILDEIRHDFKEELLEKKAVIESVALCEVSVIRFQFYQILHNLISNSLKFSSNQTTPHIVIKSRTIPGEKLRNENPGLLANGLSSKIDYCHITYTDNGIGFESVYNNRIFEMFQRLHSQEQYKGTGIGLAICKRIVENHHGVITASGHLNKGARFDIYIPVKSDI